MKTEVLNTTEAAESKRDVEKILEILIDVEKNGTIPWEEIKNKLYLRNIP